MPSKLQRILDQIDQDLLQAHDISVEHLGHRGFLKHNHVIRHIVGFHQRFGLETLVGYFILSHLWLLREHLQDEFKRIFKAEIIVRRLEDSLLYHLDVKQVANQAEQELQLGDYNVY